MKMAFGGTKAWQTAVIASILLMISLIAAAQTMETPQTSTPQQPAYQPKFPGDPRARSQKREHSAIYAQFFGRRRNTRKRMTITPLH